MATNRLIKPDDNWDELFDPNPVRNQQINAYVHNLSLEIFNELENKRLSGKEIDELNKRMKAQIFAENPGIDVVSLDKIVNSVWQRVQKLSSLDREARIALERESQAEARVLRLTPPPVVNPNVAGDLASGEVISAARGFGHKLGRVFATGSPQYYELPTVSGTRSPQLSRQLAQRQLREQAAAAALEPRRNQLTAELDTIKSNIETLLTNINTEKKLSAEILSGFKKTLSGVESTAVLVRDFEESLKAKQLEADLQNRTGGQKVLGSVQLGFRIFFFDRAVSKKYADLFRIQSELEQKIMKLETRLKTDLQIDLAANPVEDNLNAQSNYDPANMDPAEFSNRQTRLNNRLDFLKNLLDGFRTQSKGKVTTIKQNIKQTKADRTSRRTEVRNIESLQKFIEKKSPAEIERIFWHEFGDAVTMIRAWQSNLPQVARSGRTAYVTQTTAISRQYQGLKQRVLEFEVINGLGNKLSNLLIQELGIVETLPEANIALTMARGQLEIIKSRLVSVIQRNTSVPATPPISAFYADLVFGPKEKPFIYKDKVSIVLPVTGYPHPGEGLVDYGPLPIPATPPVLYDDLILNSNTQRKVDETNYVDNVSVVVPGHGYPQMGKEFFDYTTNPAPAPAPTPVPVLNATPTPTPQQPKATSKLAPGSAPVSTPAPVSAPASAPALQSTVNTNTLSLIEAKEVPRKTEVLVIGDLNGSLEGFTNNLLTLKVIEIQPDGSWKWIAGDRELVILGDIMADRVPEGLEIYKKIIELKKQLRPGIITTIFGNHEDLGVSFLTGRPMAGEEDSERPDYSWGNTLRNWQGLGNLEFIANYTQYGHSLGSDVSALKTDIETNYVIDFKKFITLGPEARQNMLADPEGRKILEEICNSKLVYRSGEALFLHTELTTQILVELTSGANLDQTIEEINNEFSKALRSLLIEQKEMTGYPRFTDLCRIFLHPDNRNFQYKHTNPLDSAQLEELAGLGITKVFHGHTYANGGQTYKYKDLIEFINVDYGTGLPGEDPDLRSTAYLDREDSLHLGKTQSEQIETFDGNVAKTDYWLGEIFANHKLNFEPMVRPLLGLLQIKTSDEIDDMLLFNAKLSSFLGNLTSSIYLPKGEVLQPRIDQIYEMINFYFEYLYSDSRSMHEIITEMESYGVSLMEIPEEWENRRTNAVTLPPPAPVIRVQTTQVSAAITTSASHPVIPQTPKATLVILSKDQTDQIDFEELEKTAVENLGDLLGANASTANMILHFLSELKLTENKKYRSFIRLINQYPDVLGFLFTLKYAGKEIIAQKSKKRLALSLAISNNQPTDLVEALNKPASLQKISELLRSGKIQEIVTMLTAAKTVLAWIKALKKS